MITKDAINSLFKLYLEQINDVQLRAKVVQTWLDGCQQGHWDSLAELKKMPFTLLVDTHGVNFIDHTLAVTHGAIELAKGQQKYSADLPYKINFDWLIAGSLLHDVGKLLELESDSAGGFRTSFQGKCVRHPISGAILAANNGIPPEIINMIGCHAKEGEGRTQRIETVLIHQADFASFNPLVMLDKGTLIRNDSEK